MIQKIHNPEKSFLTNAEIAQILHVTRVSVYRWVKSGKLKAFRTPGGNYRILTNDFKKFLTNYGMDEFAGHALQNLSIKILIVDDEPKVIETIKIFLEQINPSFHVAGATSGFEAGQLVLSFKPDIIILDLIMPGVDGFTVCREIKSRPSTKNIKIIAITGYPTEENIEKIKKAGADAVFAKPFDYNQLLQEIQKIKKS